MIRNKVTAKTKKNSKNIETVTNQNDKEISKEKYISSKRQKIIHELRLTYNNEMWKNNKFFRSINQLNLEQKIGLKQLMMHVERMTLIVKLNLKLQC